MWEQHCYDSVLAGKAVSAEDDRLAVNTANLRDATLARETPTTEQAYKDVRA